MRPKSREQQRVEWRRPAPSRGRANTAGAATAVKFGTGALFAETTKTHLGM